MDATQLIVFAVFGLAFALVGALLVYGIRLLTKPEPQEQQPAVFTASPSPAAPAPRRGLLSRPADWVALAFLVLMFAAIARGCMGYGTDGLLSSTHDITYKISGSSGQASITYTNQTGGTEQHTVYLPWQLTVKMNQYSVANILAQKTGEAGTITCEVLDNGNPWLKSTSTAAYAVVTCAELIK